MKKFKRILSVLLAAIMLVGAVPAISAANVAFTDVSGHWAWKDGYIPYLTEKGIINGIKQPNGTYMFKPNADVTRAQYVKMMVETFGLTDTVDIDYDRFVPDEWYYTYFEKAAAQGFLVNYDKKTVDPNGAITREEAVALMVRYLEISSDQKADADYFTDYEKISEWYKDDVLLAVGAGFIDGIEQKDGTFMFKPQSTLTRAQALTIIFKAAGCIYDGSTASRDKDAHSVNNTINKGGMTISGVTFSGRNIITEGADDGKITLTNCKVKDTLYVRGGSELVLNGTTAEEVIVSGGGNITLKNNAKIEILTINTTAEIDIESGDVEELYVSTGAVNTNVKGKGDIENVNIFAAGFKSSIIPTKYSIANGIEAMLGTDKVEGSNSTGESFKVTPYATSNGNSYAVNVLTGVNGTVKLYYTNEKTAPTATQFDAIYTASKYTDSFTVRANEAISRNTVSETVGSKFKYVVLQLVSGPTKYKPVVISNSVLEGDGFNTMPEFIHRTYDIEIDPEQNGIVYWYYSTDGSIIGQGEFLNNYNSTEASLKGTLNVKKDTEALLAINSIHTKTYTYICLMAADANGNYFTPVIISIGESDFVETPRMGTKNSVVFTPELSGYLYYYFSKSASLPAKDKFLDAYNAISYHNKVKATKDVQSSFSINENLLEGYPYIIFALCDEDGKFSQPVALYADCDTGFIEGPNVIDDNKIEFMTEESGTVMFYYSESNTVPPIADFMDVYDDVASSLRGSGKVTGEKEIALSYDPDYILSYPYLILMFIDGDGYKYFPAVVALKDGTDYSAVFSDGPKYNGKDKVTFITNFDGYIFYFYSDKEFDNNNSFYSEWKDVEGTELRALANFQQTITIPDSNTKRYLNIGFSHTDDIDGVNIVTTYSIDFEKASEPEELRGTGFSSRTIAGNIFITPDTIGTMYYYKTNDVNELPKGDFQAAYDDVSTSATKPINSTSEFSISAGAYKYIVLRLKTIEGDLYEYAIIDTTSGDSVEDNQPTTTGIDRSPDDIGAALSGDKFEFTALVDGRMYISYVLGSQTQSVASFEIKVGEHYSHDLTATIQTIKNLYKPNQVSLVDFKFQVKSGDKEYKVITMGIEEFR